MDATTNLEHDATSDGPMFVLAPMPPLMLRGPDAAELCGLKYRHWLTLQDEGRLLAPVRFGRVTLWPVADLTRWVGAHCPTAQCWSKIREVRT